MPHGLIVELLVQPKDESFFDVSHAVKHAIESQDFVDGILAGIGDRVEAQVLFRDNGDIEFGGLVALRAGRFSGDRVFQL